MEILLVLVGFAATMCLVLLVGRRLLKPPRSLQERIGARRSHAEPGPAQPRGPAVLDQIAARLPAILRGNSTQLTRLLTAAGFSSSGSATAFHVARAAACVALILGGLVLGARTGKPHLQIALPACGAFAAFHGASGALKRLAKRRCERLRLGLPDALDLLVVCMEAGLGIDQAILKASKELAIVHPEISQELALVHLEMRAGIARAEALRSLGTRTGSHDLQKLAAVLIQSDRFGTSLSDSLRTHSEFLRVRRRQEAEERAAKVGVKLVFPIFFFLLPAMLVVSAGPGILQLFKHLLPALKSLE